MTAIPEGPSIQPSNATGVSLAYLETAAQALDHLAASRRLQNFFASTSCSIVLSSVRSATSRLSR